MNIKESCSNKKTLYKTIKRKTVTNEKQTNNKNIKTLSTISSILPGHNEQQVLGVFQHSQQLLYQPFFELQGSEKMVMIISFKELKNIR